MRRSLLLVHHFIVAGFSLVAPLRLAAEIPTPAKADDVTIVQLFHSEPKNNIEALLPDGLPMENGESRDMYIDGSVTEGPLKEWMFKMECTSPAWDFQIRNPGTGEYSLLVLSPDGILMETGTRGAKLVSVDQLSGTSDIDDADPSDDRPVFVQTVQDRFSRIEVTEKVKHVTIIPETRAAQCMINWLGDYVKCHPAEPRVSAEMAHAIADAIADICKQQSERLTLFRKEKGLPLSLKGLPKTKENKDQRYLFENNRDIADDYIRTKNQHVKKTVRPLTEMKP